MRKIKGEKGDLLEFIIILVIVGGLSFYFWNGIYKPSMQDTATNITDNLIYDPM